MKPVKPKESALEIMNQAILECEKKGVISNQSRFILVADVITDRDLILLNENNIFENKTGKDRDIDVIKVNS